jgi:hypothetical protein
VPNASGQCTYLWSHFVICRYWDASTHVPVIAVYGDANLQRLKGHALFEFRDGVRKTVFNTLQLG